MKEQIVKIPEDKFTADVEKDFLFDLIEKAIQKAGSPKGLYNILKSKYKLTRYNQKGISDNLRKWQKKKHRLFMDYYLKIGNYCNIEKETLFSKIKSIKLPRGKIPLKTTYPLKLNKDWAFISECIRVEGHLSKIKKRVILENTDINLIQKFKKHARKIGISNFRQDLRVKVMIPLDNKLSEIKIINIKTNEEKKAYKRILELKKGDKKEIIFTEHLINIGDSFNYLIKLKSNQFKVHVSIPTFGKIKAVSTLKTNSPYQNVTPSLIVTIGNSTFYNLLHKNFQIQTGQKSHKIFIPEIVKQLPKTTLKEIVNATLAAESTLTSKSRFIALCSLSKNYLKDFQEILLKFNITSILNKNTLKITGIRNFRKIKDNFNLILKNKKKELNKLLKIKMEQSPKGLSKSLYLKSLTELGVATQIEIRNHAGRVGNSFRQYMKELLNKKYIKRVDNVWPRKYKTTETGKQFLENNKTYWLD